jgi:hypothetical protein
MKECFMPQKKFMLYARQLRLLALLDAFGGMAANLEFQKLLFLNCQEAGSLADYDFVPYKFGAFSFTSYADRRKLVHCGLIESDEQTWRITDAGREAVKNKIDLMSAFRAFARKYGELQGNILVAETYRRYPYYATRSEIADRVLHGEPEALRRIEEAKPLSNRSGVATIGYEGRSFENYLNVLLASGISLLCDVRRNPLSRKYGFSKTTLSSGCNSVGIRYEHLPQLGIASDQRQNLKTQSDYDRLFREYKQRTLPAQIPSLVKIRRWIDEGERVALTCYERLSVQCHRKCVADELERIFGTAFKATHL